MKFIQKERRKRMGQKISHDNYIVAKRRGMKREVNWWRRGTEKFWIKKNWGISLKRAKKQKRKVSFGEMERIHASGGGTWFTGKDVFGRCCWRLWLRDRSDWYDIQSNGDWNKCLKLKGSFSFLETFFICRRERVHSFKHLDMSFRISRHVERVHRRLRDHKFVCTKRLYALWRRFCKRRRLDTNKKRLWNRRLLNLQNKKRSLRV